MEMEEIVEANRAAGKFFFDENTMAKFDTKLIDATFDHVGGDRIYFATNDRDYSGTERVYKVRVFSKESASVWTPSPSADMSFTNESDALDKAKELAETPDVWK